MPLATASQRLDFDESKYSFSAIAAPSSFRDSARRWTNYWPAVLQCQSQVFDVMRFVKCWSEDDLTQTATGQQVTTIAKKLWKYDGVVGPRSL